MIRWGVCICLVWTYHCRYHSDIRILLAFQEKINRSSNFIKLFPQWIPYKNNYFVKFKFQQQSVCTEMAEELRYAIRCDGTKHKATLKRTCNGCSPITTYVPAPMHINHVTSQIVSYNDIMIWYRLFNENAI